MKHTVIHIKDLIHCQVRSVTGHVLELVLVWIKKVRITLSIIILRKWQYTGKDSGGGERRRGRGGEREERKGKVKHSQSFGLVSPLIIVYL